MMNPGTLGDPTTELRSRARGFLATTLTQQSPPSHTMSTLNFFHTVPSRQESGVNNRDRGVCTRYKYNFEANKYLSVGLILMGFLDFSQK